MIRQGTQQDRSEQGAYVLTDSEAEELEQACVEADDDEENGRLVPLADVLRALRGA